ncbi:C1 family peptidase [Pedobacter sp. KACC 23697]|uniref:C1 family peptidase n=1 Tax=Pedobacter sp. KACC 23697 TaxID=3149230 RepID=A0AAU7K470_9SPHI
MNQKPILTNFYQVIGLDKFLQLKAAGFIQKSDINWGSNRVVSLKQRDTSVKNQWNGTCTSFATIAAIENKLGGKIDLSERSLWDFYGVFSTPQAINAAQHHYILEEIYWPQYQIRFDTRYSSKGRFLLTGVKDLKNDYLAVLKALDIGNPCIVALQTPEDLYTGKAQVERTSRILSGGHAICVSGYKVEDGKGYFLVKNSWGTENGDSGYQYIDFNVFDKKGYANFWEVSEITDRGDQQMEFENTEDYLTSIVED